MMPVRFKVGQAPYNAGEVAGFPPAEAERMIAAGVAEAYASPPVVKAPATPPANKMVRATATKPANTRKK